VNGDPAVSANWRNKNIPDDRVLESNRRGFVTFATSGPNSRTTQFFINTKSNDSLNHRSPDPRGFGYCVFGKVIDGMDIVVKIENVATGTKNRFQNVPVETITIESVRRK